MATIEVIPPEAQESDFNFEKAFDDVRCHLFREQEMSVCNKVHRSEQPAHGQRMKAEFFKSMIFCPWCGNEYCQECKNNVDNHDELV